MASLPLKCQLSGQALDDCLFSILMLPIKTMNEQQKQAIHIIPNFLVEKGINFNSPICLRLYFNMRSR